MFTVFVGLGPVDDFLFKILNDPLLLILFVVAMISILAGGYGLYEFMFQSGEKSRALSVTNELLEELKFVKSIEGNPHGGESAQGLLDDWEDLKQDLSGKRGIIRIKKFNLKAEAFLVERGYFQEEE